MSPASRQISFSAVVFSLLYVCIRKLTQSEFSLRIDKRYFRTPSMPSRLGNVMTTTAAAQTFQTHSKIDFNFLSKVTFECEQYGKFGMTAFNLYMFSVNDIEVRHWHELWPL